MGHHQHHQHQKDGENTKALRIAFWLNLSFSIIEIAIEFVKTPPTISIMLNDKFSQKAVFNALVFSPSF